MAVKTCSKCCQEKSLRDFHRHRRNKDGYHSWCKDCARANVDRNKAKKRAEMGDEAWLKHQAELVRKSREKNGYARNRLLVTARTQALTQLAKAHPSEYARLLKAAKYERGLL